MTTEKTSISRRGALRMLGAASALAASGTAWGQTIPEASPPVLMDGHVHAINRVFWEKVDLWDDVPGTGWDFRRARMAGVNCIIENLGTYGYWNYNYTPKQALAVGPRSAMPSDTLRKILILQAFLKRGVLSPTAHGGVP